MNRNTLLFVMVFAMGFIIMSVELLGGRILSPYFGNTIYIWGSIITVFMLALSFGYALGGLYSKKNPSMHKFGMIFIIAAAGLWLVILFSDPLGEWLFVRFEDPRSSSLIFCMLIFFLPTVVMGFASPYAVSLTTASRETSGLSAGFLYFISTLGSSLGTLLTSFYFVMWLETNVIIQLCSLTLFLLGILALIQHRITQ